MTEEKIRAAVEVGDGMNGLKMVLGAALIALAHQVDMLNDLIGINAEWDPVFQSAVYYLKYGIQGIEWLSTLAGNGLLSIGALHKIWKFFKG